MLKSSFMLMYLFQRMKHGITTVLLMLSFLILKWEDDLLWKRFKNIELIYETWSREVWFFFPYSTHVNFFFSIFCSVKKIDLHLICFCFVFGSSFEANWKETHSTPYPNFSVRKILAYFYVTPKNKLTASIWVTLGFKRMRQKVVCVSMCVFLLMILHNFCL